jgi:hypothetical protein
MADDQDKQRCTGKRADGKPCRGAPVPGTTRCWHHSYRVPGRPRKVTPDVTERVVESLLEGNYVETAAAIVGISKATLYRWLRQAEDLEAVAAEHADDLDDPDSADVYQLTDPRDWPLLDFRHAVKSAEAWAETELVRQAKGAAVTGAAWQAFVTILERRHPQRWGRRKVLDHRISGELEARGSVHLHVPPEGERARAVMELLERAGALDDPDQEA